MRPGHANCIEMSGIVYECHDTKGKNIGKYEKFNTRQCYFVEMSEIINFNDETSYT